MEQFEFGEITEDAFVMITWHENEPLKDVFWFAKNCAFHPTIELANTLILHLSESDRAAELKAEYNEA